ncbi:MAG: sulfatase [Sorangiineae bacterium]|nr:sulfatase [Polyangiaceae bacterium]MEB2324895.1 sulfatase [Sorangiineae bacterium]
MQTSVPALVTLGLLALAACGRAEPPAGRAEPASPAPASSAGTSAAVAASAAPPAPAAPARPKNVILLSVDSMRHDMPWAGYERPIAPNLTRLVERAVYYDNAYSLSSYTAKSLPGLLAGRYPSSLYRSGYFFTNYPQSNLFFTELLQEHGVRTIGMHAHLYFGRGKGVDQGFDVWELVPGIRFDAQKDNDITSEKMTRLAMELLGKPENTGKPFFAWMHYMDPHDVYLPHDECPKEWAGGKTRDKYDCEVFYTDLWIGKLLDWAKTQPWWKETALIVTADHGEAFGEHGMYRHAFELWQELVHVPLFFVLPGVEPRKIEAARSDIDLAPTICELLGVAPDARFVGKSLMPELYGKEPPGPDETVVLDLPADSNNEQRRGIIEQGFKLIVYGNGWKYLLFDLKADPGEKNDLSKQQPEKLAAMKQRFGELWGKIPQVDPYGGMKLTSGKEANGPMGPPKGEGAKP